MLSMMKMVLLNIGALLLIFLGALTMPVWMPLATFLRFLHHRYRRRLARKSRCVNCQGMLGHEAVDLRNSKVRAEVSTPAFKTLEDIPQRVRTHYLNLLVAVCPHCGTYHRLDRSKKGLCLLDDTIMEDVEQQVRDSFDFD